MKRTLVFVLACVSSTAWSANSVNDSDTPAPVNAREFDKAADKKTLRECMKPDNLIDDDVRKCMKGL